ncbi:Ankyrin repeat-containing protein [Streptosporangium subroseum]|uniref:Ankyrin repeat-containing protein n=1 Tax=Streptosporangium subroseum TaxID=106412 RepID=A0A239CVV5_9ACTN|nr:ankyrin repeat domain-containing protein [Streptosporangium subroseum]SNS24376.1 Ankyrin repeat-containing protein [Streptosporangium subroseum]
MYDAETPLHDAAESGSPEEIAELARNVEDVDAEDEGRTALWVAVYERRHDNARALVAAGADPWRPMMSGWSPGRLSLAGPEPDLFDRPAGVDGLTADEASAVAEAKRLTAALSDPECTGLGLACVAGISAAEAARRLDATVEAADPGKFLDEISPFDEESRAFVGVTDVPGGCVVTQPWGHLPQTPGVTKRLSAGTVCYGLFDNAASGSQGSIIRDGEIVGWDLHPGGAPWEDDGPKEVLFSYLYQYNPVAYSYAYAGLRPTDARAVTGPPDVWLRLPERDYWR